MSARALAAALILFIPAGAAHAQLMLSAVVAKSAQVAVHDHPATIQVSETDIARGYLDIAAGPRIEVRTNSREGLLVTFLAGGEAVRAVQVRGNSSDSILLPGAVRGVVSRRIDANYRLLLAPSARPGVYPWPVQVVAAPL